MIEFLHMVLLSPILAFALCAAAAGSFAADSDPVSVRLADAAVVCEDGYFGGRTSVWGLGAVEALTNVIARTTGARIPVFPEGREPVGLRSVIYLGCTRRAASAGVDVRKLGAAGFRIRAEKGRVFIAARTGTGASHGVTEFARRFCDYWFLTVADEDPVVVDPDRTVRCCDISGRPVIASREIYHDMFDSRKHPTTDRLWHRWTRMRRAAPGELDGKDRVSLACGAYSHTTFRYCPPERYFKDHPEYYSQTPEGVRQHSPVGQLCYSNPEVRRICLASLRSFIASDRKRNPASPPLIYDFTQQDNTGWLCWCPDCRRIIAKYNRVKGGNREGGDAGLQLEFVNWLAREIAKEYPDVVLRTFAYNSTEEPPQGLVPEPNVMIWLCDLYSECDHMLPLGHPFNARRAGLLRSWKEISRHLEIWDYMLYSSKHPPEVSADAIAADARLFRDLGVSRVMMESEYHNQAFFELNFFLLSELYFNPDLDVDDLVRIYCRVYGAGASEMEAAISSLRRLIQSEPPADANAWHSRLLKWRNARDMEWLRELVRAAYAKTPKGAERSRIAKVLSCVSLELMRLYRATPGRENEYAAAKADYVRYGSEDADYAIMEPEERPRVKRGLVEQAALMDLIFKDLPHELRGVAKCDINCFDWRRIGCEPNARRVDDPDSETGHAAVWKLGRPHPAKFTAGLYDRQLKTNAGFDIPLGSVAADAKYHWYRLGVARLGRDSVFWVPSDWGISFRGLNEYYIECDGLKKDPNWYELWLSVKYNTKPNGLWVDRMILRHVDPPAGGEKE